MVLTNNQREALRLLADAADGYTVPFMLNHGCSVAALRRLARCRLVVTVGLLARSLMLAPRSAPPTQLHTPGAAIGWSLGRSSRSIAAVGGSPEAGRRAKAAGLPRFRPVVYPWGVQRRRRVLPKMSLVLCDPARRTDLLTSVLLFPPYDMGYCVGFDCARDQATALRRTAVTAATMSASATTRPGQLGGGHRWARRVYAKPEADIPNRRLGGSQKECVLGPTHISARRGPRHLVPA
jgi:hypothetical protein